MADELYEVTTTVRLKHPDGLEAALAFVRDLLRKQGMPVVRWRADSVAAQQKRASTRPARRR